MPFPDLDSPKTVERMGDPQPGDRFHEMCSHWVWVLARIDDKLVIWTNSQGDYGNQMVTVDEFREMYSYGAIPGYTVDYYDRLTPNHYVPEGQSFDEWWTEYERKRDLKMCRESFDSAKL